MRLAILDDGHPWYFKLLFKLVRLVTGAPPPDVLKLHTYRRGFFGKPAGRLTHDCLRRAEHWTVGECELFASYVSHLNQCLF